MTEDGFILAQMVKIKSNYTSMLSGADSFIVFFNVNSDHVLFSKPINNPNKTCVN